MVSLINISNEQRNRKSEKTKRKQDLTGNVPYYYFYEKVEVILWSMRTLWYKGLAKFKEKMTAQVRRLIFQKSFYLVFGG